MINDISSNKTLLLLESINIINSNAEPDEILNKIVEITDQLIHSQQTIILIYDYVVNGLRTMANSLCHDENFQDDIIEIESSFLGSVFFKEEPTIIKNINTDDKFNHEIDGKICLVPDDVKSVIAVPMILKSTRLGVVVTFFTEEQQELIDDKIILLNIIASQAAIAISNAKMVQDMQSTLDNIANFEQMKTAFIAITAHELRTPLGVIIGYATYLQKLVTEKNQEFIDAILNSAIRLKDIIEDTRTLKNFQNEQATIHLKKTKINHLIEDVVKANTYLAETENILLQMDFPNDDIKAYVDREKFTAAIDHIIRNAILFNKQNGLVKIILEENDSFFTVSILDNGIGIPEKDLEKVFERFYQVSSHLTRVRGGMGLGLSISKSIIEMHNGQISLQSIVGRGSRFIIMVPKEPEKLN